MYVHAHVTSGYFSDFESATASCSYEFMTSLWLPWPQGWGHPSSGHGHCTELLLRVPDLGRAIRRQLSPREVESCDLANWNTSEHIGSAKYCEWIRDTLRLETVDWNGHFQCFGWIWMPPDHPRSLVRPSQTCAVLASWFRLRQMMNASISTYHAYAGATVLVWHQWVSCILLHAWMKYGFTKLRWSQDLWPSRFSVPCSKYLKTIFQWSLFVKCQIFNRNSGSWPEPCRSSGKAFHALIRYPCQIPTVWWRPGTESVGEDVNCRILLGLVYVLVN